MIELKESQWSFECDVTDAAPPTVDTVAVQEGLNQLYDAEVMLISSDLTIEPETLLGKAAAIVLERSPLEPRRFCGIIEEVEVEPHTNASLLLDLRLRPALFMSTLDRDSRIFQNMRVPDIVEQVLGEALTPYKRTLRFELVETYPVREYVVQYQESTYDFVARLLEEEGISYAFDHEETAEIVVFRDKNTSYREVPTVEDGVLHLEPGGEVVIRTHEPLLRFQPQLQTTTTKVALRDRDFTKQTLTFEGEDGGPDAREMTRERYEHGIGLSMSPYEYDSGVRRYGENDVDRQKRIRLEAHTREERVVYSAQSTVIGLAPGQTFAPELGGLEIAGDDEEYLVLRAFHSSSGPAAGDPYSNTFDCVPITKEFRPSRQTPKPRIASVQTAVVTGPAGEEIHVDEYGRIKVQFYWDREGNLDEKSSCWVRTQQTWAGNGFGTWWVPRIGMEVIVQFVDGDPDRPMVTGCVYNANNALPYALPDEKTKSTVKSNSTLGGNGFNEFRFEDKAGSEEIWLHAQKDLNEKVLHDHSLIVDNHEVINIGVNRTIEVGANFTETIDGNEVRTIQGTCTETIVGGETRVIKGGSTTTIEGPVNMNITGGYNRTFVGPVRENYAGGIERSIVGDHVIKVPSGKFRVEVGGASIEITQAGKIILTATTGVDIIGGGGDVDVKGGPNIKLNCS